MKNRKPRRTGYKNPPQESRFKPGKSGNPKGRPKGSTNLATAIRKEMNTKVTVVENNRRKTITKTDVVAKQLVNKAAQGDPKATATLARMDVDEPLTNAAEHPPMALEECDEKVLENALLRVLRNRGLTIDDSAGIQTKFSEL